MTQANEGISLETGEFARCLEELSAIAQNGLTYATNAFDIERYRRLRVLAAEMLGRLSGAEAVSVQNWLSLDSNYVTPKLDVRALVMRGDDVLLVQEREDGRWSLPGGWCDVHQSPGESVEKEVREETGLMVRASRLLALLDKRKHDYPMQIPHAYKCFFLCEEYGGALVGSTIEIGQAAFVPWTDLPPLSLHRVTRSQVETIVQIGKDPARATAFD